MKLRLVILGVKAEMAETVVKAETAVMNKSTAEMRPHGGGEGEAPIGNLGCKGGNGGNGGNGGKGGNGGNGGNGANLYGD